MLSPQRVAQRELTPQRFVGWSPRSNAATDLAVACGVKQYVLVRAKQRAELVYGRTSFHRGRALEPASGPDAAFLFKSTSRDSYLAVLRLAQA